MFFIADELEDLYYSFETDKYQEEYHKYTLKRAKVIIGLMMYQGLNTADLGNLQIEHLQLSKGKIYVPSTTRSNARKLELKPWQIMEYVAVTRFLVRQAVEFIRQWTQRFGQQNIAVHLYIKLALT